MANLKLIKEEVLKVFEKHKLVLYSLDKTKLGNDEGITVLIDNTLNSNDLEIIHKEVLENLEELLPDNYYLELSTVGIERPLKTIDELLKNIGEYIYLESDIYSGNATLENVIDNKVEISYFIKGRPKKSSIDYSQTRNIRKAVKF